jgi:hypothetical protein
MPAKRKVPKKPAEAKPAAPTLAQQRGISKKSAFLAAFRATASVVKAAKAVRLERGMHYQWLASDPAYGKAFEDARIHAVQILEDEAVRRAHEGYLEPIYYQGEEVGVVLKYSDALLMFLLRGWKPERYRERAEVEHSGPGGGPIDLRLTKLAEILTPDELSAIRSRFAALAG